LISVKIGTRFFRLKKLQTAGQFRLHETLIFDFTTAAALGKQVENAAGA
jgi:hypothetical protein